MAAVPVDNNNIELIFAWKGPTSSGPVGRDRSIDWIDLEFQDSSFNTSVRLSEFRHEGQWYRVDFTRQDRPFTVLSLPIATAKTMHLSARIFQLYENRSVMTTDVFGNRSYGTSARRIDKPIRLELPEDFVKGQLYCLSVSSDSELNVTASFEKAKKHVKTKDDAPAPAAAAAATPPPAAAAAAAVVADSVASKEQACEKEDDDYETNASETNVPKEIASIVGEAVFDTAKARLGKNQAIFCNQLDGKKCLLANVYGTFYLYKNRSEVTDEEIDSLARSAGCQLVSSDTFEPIRPQQPVAAAPPTREQIEEERRRELFHSFFVMKNLMNMFNSIQQR